MVSAGKFCRNHHISAVNLQYVDGSLHLPDPLSLDSRKISNAKDSTEHSMAIAAPKRPKHWRERMHAHNVVERERL